MFDCRYRVDLEPEFVAGETRHTDARFGRFALWLPVGEWRLRFAAEGYEDATSVVRVVEGQTLDLEIRLTKTQPARLMERLA